MPKFAAETKVSTEQSRAEIEKTLRRYGCNEFGYTTSPTSAAIGFRMKGLSIKFVLPLPSPDKFKLTPERGLERSHDAKMMAWEQACRQRWRALALAIKAKLETVECGISTVESEFLAYVVTDTGQTIGERMLPRLAEIATGSIPLLPPPSAR